MISLLSHLLGSIGLLVRKSPNAPPPPRITDTVSVLERMFKSFTFYQPEPHFLFTFLEKIWFSKNTYDGTDQFWKPEHLHVEKRMAYQWFYFRSGRLLAQVQLPSGSPDRRPQRKTNFRYHRDRMNRGSFIIPLMVKASKMIHFPLM